MTTALAPSRRAWVEQIMGLPVSVHLRGPHVFGTRAERLVNALFAELRRVDAVFSTYRDDSDLSRWERGELGLAEADRTLREVLALCETARRRTNGWFDARGLPDPYRRGLRLDPSGLVKGWAVERAAARLTQLAGHDWCVNAGGDITVGAAEGHPPWRIGIEDPADPGRILRVVTLASGAVATSGGTHRGPHIVDPRAKRPATGVRAVTVIGPSLMWADVYATAGVVGGPDALGWLARLDGYQALLVDRFGTIATTAGWPATGRA